MSGTYCGDLSLGSSSSCYLVVAHHAKSFCLLWPSRVRISVQLCGAGAAVIHSRKVWKNSSEIRVSVMQVAAKATLSYVETQVCFCSTPELTLYITDSKVS